MRCILFRASLQNKSGFGFGLRFCSFTLPKKKIVLSQLVSFARTVAYKLFIVSQLCIQQIQYYLYSVKIIVTWIFSHDMGNPFFFLFLTSFLVAVIEVSFKRKTNANFIHYSSFVFRFAPVTFSDSICGCWLFATVRNG